MKHLFLVSAAVTACILAVFLGTFCLFQIYKCDQLEEQIKVLQPQNEQLKLQIQGMSSNIENNQKKQKPMAAANVLTNSVSTSNQKTAYLTFDDGPSQNTPHLLEILKEYDVKATFFVVAMSEDTPQRRLWMKMEVSDGNSIGVHSYTHKYNYIYANETNFLTDFNEMRNMIVSATGVEPKFSRFPGGTDNTVSLTLNHGSPIMPKLLQDVEDMGITPVDWNAGAVDAVIPVPSKDTIATDVVNQCRELKTAVILLHDSQPHESSIDAVPEIITKLRDMGFVFEPLIPGSQVIRRNPALKESAKTKIVG